MIQHRILSCSIRTRSWRLVAVAILTSILAGVGMARPEPEVRDQAHWLDPATIEHVNSIVKEIRQRFGKDLTIATFDTIPDRQAASFTAKNKQEFYDDWLREEARAAGTNGVFILILKSPGHLQIGVGDSTRLHDFHSAKDRDGFNAMMLKAFHDKGIRPGRDRRAQVCASPRGSRKIRRRGRRRPCATGSPPSHACGPATIAATTRPGDPAGIRRET